MVLPTNPTVGNGIPRRRSFFWKMTTPPWTTTTATASCCHRILLLRKSRPQLIDKKTTTTQQNRERWDKYIHNNSYWNDSFLLSYHTLKDNALHWWHRVPIAILCRVVSKWLSFNLYKSIHMVWHDQRNHGNGQSVITIISIGGVTPGNVKHHGQEVEFCICGFRDKSR